MLASFLMCSRRRDWLVSAAMIGMTAACATATPVQDVARAPTRAPSRDNGSAERARDEIAVEAASAPQLVRWPVKTAAHVDVWLHAFALVTNDTTLVPLFKRGYRDSLTVIKNRLGLYTSLDSNRVWLTKGIVISPRYQEAQLLALDVNNWGTLRAFSARFAQLDGDLSRADDAIAFRLRAYETVFPAAEDRAWFRRFWDGVNDEHVQFYIAEHSRTVRARAAVITAVDALWQQVYRTKFDRVLRATNMQSGDLVVSLPLGGSGRMGGSRERPMVVVPLPDRVADAPQAIYVFAHEIAGIVASSVVVDFTSQAERRSGVADGYVTSGRVLAGALLLERVAPELLDGYRRYYLQHSGAPVDTSMASAPAFAARFPLPDKMRNALGQQFDAVLGGI
ncbi:MAG: hypothetical protein IT354_04905 [Gemmatimonadaceae bacterium]|nr:hypothetical protein [Gemmatimonadaceae bacterium]